MPRHETLTLPRDSVVELTANDAAALTLRNDGPCQITLVASVGASAVAVGDNGLVVRAGKGELSLDLAAAFPGLAGANRVYAYQTAVQQCAVFVSHA